MRHAHNGPKSARSERLCGSVLRRGGLRPRAPTQERQDVRRNGEEGHHVSVSHAAQILLYHIRAALRGGEAERSKRPRPRAGASVK